MTELKNTYYKQLRPGEMHLFVKPNSSFDYRNKLKWIDDGCDVNSLSFENNEFVTNMVSITSYEKRLISSKIKEIISVLPGKYCLIYSHFTNLKPDYIKPFYILDVAFASINEISKEYVKN